MPLASPPRPPPRLASLWVILDYIADVGTWLVSAVLSLMHGQDALETHMTQQDADLTAAVATLQGNLDALQAEQASEIADLAAAINEQIPQPSQAVNDAIVAIQASNARISGMTAGLAADNPPTP